MRQQRGSIYRAAAIFALSRDRCLFIRAILGSAKNSRPSGITIAQLIGQLRGLISSRGGLCIADIEKFLVEYYSSEINIGHLRMRNWTFVVSKFTFLNSQKWRWGNRPVTEK